MHYFFNSTQYSYAQINGRYSKGSYKNIVSNYIASREVYNEFCIKTMLDVHVPQPLLSLALLTFLSVLEHTYPSERIVLSAS